MISMAKCSERRQKPKYSPTLSELGLRSTEASRLAKIQEKWDDAELRRVSNPVLALCTAMLTYGHGDAQRLQAACNRVLASRDAAKEPLVKLDMDVCDLHRVLRATRGGVQWIVDIAQVAPLAEVLSYSPERLVEKVFESLDPDLASLAAGVGRFRCPVCGVINDRRKHGPP